MFGGVGGLGIGFVLGSAWEQVHRARRKTRTSSGAVIEVLNKGDGAMESTSAPAIGMTEQPRLRLVPMSNEPNTHVVGSRLTSVSFRERTVEFDFAGVVIEDEGGPVVLDGTQRFCYPEEGSRDALCRLIGSTVHRMRVTGPTDLELVLDNGAELIIRARRR